MNSFTVMAVGNLAKDPELAVKGDTTYTRFCLVGNDYAGKDDNGNARESVTSIYFVAFESLGEAIARNARSVLSSGLVNPVARWDVAMVQSGR